MRRPNFMLLPMMLLTAVAVMTMVVVVAIGDTDREQLQTLGVRGRQQQPQHARGSENEPTRHQKWLSLLSTTAREESVPTPSSAGRTARTLKDDTNTPSPSVSFQIPDLLLQLAESQQPIGVSGSASTNVPTRGPSASPTATPTTVEPTTSAPSFRPTVAKLTSGPTARPTTSSPSSGPTTNEPSRKPSDKPTQRPSLKPSEQPSPKPSHRPTLEPSHQPTFKPSHQPTFKPSRQPTLKPSHQPTFKPSHQPTFKPSRQPTFKPSRQPTFKPSHQPALNPSHQPSTRPTDEPTRRPTFNPTNNPTFSKPTRSPISEPTPAPSSEPTIEETVEPSAKRTPQPSLRPSFDPTYEPTAPPTLQPSSEPTFDPTFEPTIKPSRGPTHEPTLEPSFEPSAKDTRPCAMSSTKREESLLKFFLDNNIGKNFGLNNIQEPPEDMALKFITVEDQLELCADSPNLKQRFGLATLYFSTKGDNWDNCSRYSADECGGSGDTGDYVRRQNDGNQNVTQYSNFENRRLEESVPGKPFLSGVSECEWFGVTCDASGRVTGVDLPNNNLKGSLHPILFLTLGDNLTRLVLSENKLKSVIPEEIGLATKLNFLVLFSNSLHGALPSEMVNLSGLKRLLLYDNDFTGPITLLGELKELRSLRLHNNHFRGVIPTELGSATGLTVATFHNNLFNGSMPVDICLNRSPIGALETLTTDCFSEYMIIDCLCCTDCFEGIRCGMTDGHREFGMWENFQAFSDSQDLKDTSTPQGRALQWLVYDDEYKVCVQDENVDQRYALAVLYFATAGKSEAGWKECKGDRDECVTDLQARQASSSEDGAAALFMSSENECLWDGVVCDERGRVTEVVLDGKSLGGEIPRELAALSHLTKLDLSNNKIKGNLTRKLKHLHKLEVLKLNKNELGGDLPDVMDEWATSIKTFDIGNNFMTGSIDVICDMPNVEILELQGNLFSGEISPKFADMTQLVIAKFHGNKLTGTLPEDICQNYFPLGNLEDISADCNEVLECFCCSCYPREEFYGGP